MWINAGGAPKLSLYCGNVNEVLLAGQRARLTYLAVEASFTVLSQFLLEGRRFHGQANVSSSEQAPYQDARFSHADVHSMGT
jgi:hypothetical protein